MKTSPAGVALIKRWEGCKLKAYKCPADVWTIGYGHTKTAKPGMVITEAEAERLLQTDLGTYERGIVRRVLVPLAQYQFDALVSFTYNLGLGAFEKSTLLKKLNASDMNGAAKEFPKWNKAAGKVLNGLTKRRLAEQAMFEGK